MSILGIIAFENLLPEYQNQKAIFTTGALKLLQSTKTKKLNKSASRTKQRGHDLLTANRKEEKSHYVSLSVLDIMSLNCYALAELYMRIKCWYD